MPSELLRCVLMRIEASDDAWPDWKHAVACASVYHSWRGILKEIVKSPAEVSGKLTFPISLKQSSAPVELTKAETEYAVNVVKHIIDNHVMFQYNCTNTIPEQLVEDVTITMDALKIEEFSKVISRLFRSLPYDSPGQTFVAFKKLEGKPAVGKFSNILKFNVKEVDPTTGEAEEDGVEDEYQLEDLEVVAADYMMKVGVSNFKNVWESMGDDCERVDEYGLGLRESLAEAV